VPEAHRLCPTDYGRRMRVEVRMPNLGSDMDSGKVVAWLKQVGDAVVRGEVIAEIETDKTTVEMEAMAAGTLAEIVVAEGDVAAVGAVIAYLEGDG
jgi:pyruvate/2-oxoglutarate dehydrogenase complex dihydrolipoamide acyltransferase (E2) component